MTVPLKGDAFSWKPTKESSRNVDFAIEKPPQYLAINKASNILLNFTNCDKGNNLLKNNLDEQLKEIRKCHHQKYLDTKAIIKKKCTTL